jgi:transposase
VVDGRAAQTFVRWTRLGVWDRLLRLVQARGVELGLAFLDGTSVRAHQKAAGAASKRPRARAEAQVRLLAVLVAAMAPRPA